jgi:diguanylate cyclase (GGDEF)-like protein/PAS domain S-box-containing protein
MRDDLYKSILENLYEGVYIVDRDRTITFWNKGAERITGFKSEELIGRHCYDNVLNHIDGKSDKLCQRGCPLNHTIQDGAPREATVSLHHKGGQRLEVAVKTIPLFEDGVIVGAAEFFIDDAYKAEINRTINELKGLALLDPLTDLPNRRFVDSYLDNRMSEFYKLGIPFSVIMMDIDNFKRVNDTYGHDVGDQVLKMLAETLRGAFRKSDIVGRWGGEEFLAAIIGGTREALERLCEKVRVLVKNSSLRTEERALCVTISIGASVVTAEDTISTLLKRADNALYASKNAGRDKVTVL